MADQPRVFHGRYTLVRQIARGGMAAVHLARDTKLDRLVAIKVLYPELSIDPSFVERFRREAQAAAGLSHPNIVSIYDWGEAEGTYFIVMEYIEGEPLSAVIRSEGSLLPDRAADIGADVAAALDFAHRNGVIHRDVKPGNVIITADGHVKVTDFGIARAVNTSENLTQTGAVMGTATYFSPEQARGSALDARTDVYSLGVVLYEMVAGRPPFVGDGPMAVAYQHVHDAIPSPRQHVPAIPPAFEAIVLQSLAKDPARRYASAEELRADLLRYRQGRQVLATAPDEAAMATAGAGRPARVRGGRTTQATTRVTPAVPPAEPGEEHVTTVVSETPPPQRSTTWMYAGLLAVLLVALGVVLFLLGRSLGAFGGGSASSTKVAIPGDLIGKSFSEASAELSAAHLTAKEVDSPNAAAAGQVFRVVPEPGSRVASGSTVELDVSTGPSTSGALIIPNVVGTTYPQPGGQTLQAAGFVVVLQTTPSSSPYGTILSQDPPGGASGHQGDKVTVVVSTGPAAVTVPDVAGKTLADAAYALGQAGFRYTTQKEPSDSVPAGNVTRTDPPGGTQAPRGSTVTVFVSNGPATVSVPDVVGMTQAEATSTLEAKGFNAQVVSVTVFDPTEDGRVQSQSPQGGTLAPQGSTVTINVGRFGSG